MRNVPEITQSAVLTLKSAATVSLILMVPVFPDFGLLSILKVNSLFLALETVKVPLYAAGLDPEMVNSLPVFRPCSTGLLSVPVFTVTVPLVVAIL